MPFLCQIRSDIPRGVLQVLDLRPNESQRNLIYEPRGQTKYLSRPQNDTLAALAANATVATYQGVAAYLIDNVIDNGGATITVTVANAAAVLLIADMDTGTTDLDITRVNAQLVAGGAGAGTTLNTGGSTGVLTDLLKVLAGAEYTLPEGSLVGGLAAGAGLGSFTEGQYLQTRQSGALEISLGDGHLAGFTDASFEWGGVVGAAVVVLDDDGTVKTAVP
jgi:hypothetical protein